MKEVRRIETTDRAALIALWDDAGRWTADTFERLNADYFGGEVPYRGIVWGLTPHGGCLGHCSCSGRITLHPALLNPRDARHVWNVPVEILGEAYAEDCLTHEMIHALFRSRGIASRGSRGEHNTPRWCVEIIRLSPLLGLSEIKAQPITPRKDASGKSVCGKAKNGYLTQRELGSWPHAVRESDFYIRRNQKIPVPI